jgi:2-polyprenyl-3-methyl-5-hydroxy-6-metoxy-1,4-benzoquinol methylase
MEPNSDIYLHPTEEKLVDRSFISQCARFIVPKLRGRRVLEMGVGQQLWTPLLVERFASVTTIDRDQTLVKNLRANVKASNWTAECVTFEDYEPDEPFDVVLATYVLEHVADPMTLLRRIRTWLHKSGQAAFVVPNALSLHRRLAVKMGLAESPGELGATDRLVGHTNCFTPFEIEDLIVRAGFRIREKAGMVTKALPNSYLVGCSEGQLQGLFELGLDLPMEYAAVLSYLVDM